MVAMTVNATKEIYWTVSSCQTINLLLIIIPVKIEMNATRDKSPVPSFSTYNHILNKPSIYGISFLSDLLVHVTTFLLSF